LPRSGNSDRRQRPRLSVMPTHGAEGRSNVPTRSRLRRRLHPMDVLRDLMGSRSTAAAQVLPAES
jgi:hypothetical protein